MRFSTEIAWYEAQISRCSEMLEALNTRVKSGELPAHRAQREIEILQDRITLSKQAIADFIDRASQIAAKP